MPTGFSKHFMETTRGQVLGLLRRGSRTVDELAAGLGLTDNAIRAHLATLERDGLVRQEGQRRGPKAGKPALVYEPTPEAELRLSRAYAPVLAALLEELVDRLPDQETESLLAAVGRRLGLLSHDRWARESRDHHRPECSSQQQRTSSDHQVTPSGQAAAQRRLWAPASGPSLRRQWSPDRGGSDDIDGVTS